MQKDEIRFSLKTITPLKSWAGLASIRMFFITKQFENARTIFKERRHKATDTALANGCFAGRFI